jgi:hypothetical protein
MIYKIYKIHCGIDNSKPKVEMLSFRYIQNFLDKDQIISKLIMSISK